MDTLAEDKNQTIVSLTHLFLSNNPPSDPDMAQLATLHHDIKNQVGEFAVRSNIEMASLLKHDPLKSLLRSLECVMSRARQLPNEILSEIFLECLPAYKGRNWISLDSRTAPWTLVGVCKRWREVALGDRRLWSSLHLDACRIEQQALPNLATCLARSGQNLLAIRFDSEPDLSLLDQLSPYSERWEFLELRVRFDPKTFELFKTIKGRLPVLHELYLSAYPEIEEFAFMEESGPFDFFDVAPSLQKVSINILTYESTIEEIVPWTDLDQFTLPWHQLTVVQTDFIDVLHRCDQLVDCKLLVHMIPDDYTKNRLITLSSLRGLTVDKTEVLDSLVLPALASLSLEHRYYNPEKCVVYAEPIRSLVSRSRCALKTLHIGQATIHPESDWPKLIADCPELHTIVVRQSDSHLMFGADIPLPSWCLALELSNGFVMYKRNCSGKMEH